MRPAALPSLPFEIQEQIFGHLHWLSLSTYAAACRLSRSHHDVLNPRLYRNICVQSRLPLENLAATLLERPEYGSLVRSFSFRGPQGRRRTGREALRYLHDVDDEDVDDEEDDHIGAEGSTDTFEEEDGMRKVGLEPGIEGEGQEATWDEHESLMYLCTLILKLCSLHLRAIGFVDCVPWFLAPTEGGAINFPLPRCQEFTGVTVGLFGLLPHLQRSKEGNTKANEYPLVPITPPTALQRIHLVGGDFGSFALQRVLISSPTAQTLTHLHITAPTLYRPEHHSHLVMHIAGLLQNTPQLQRLSVAFLHWTAAPPLKKGKRSSVGRADDDSQDGTPGTGEDSFERKQFRQRQRQATQNSASDDSDRLTECRRAYTRALPEALQYSKRTDVTVAVVKLPFAEGSPTGFAGWILSHHTMDQRVCTGRIIDEHALRVWNRRDIAALPRGIATDGAPSQSVWQAEAFSEWSFSGNEIIASKEGSEEAW